MADQESTTAKVKVLLHTKAKGKLQIPGALLELENREAGELLATGVARLATDDDVDSDDRPRESVPARNGGNRPGNNGGAQGGTAQ